MPKNKVIYTGILVIVASALLYIAAEFTALVKPILPWTGGAGVLTLVAGVFMELRKNSMAKQEEKNSTSKTEY
jgi:hypothetical protein